MEKQKIKKVTVYFYESDYQHLREMWASTGAICGVSFQDFLRNLFSTLVDSVALPVFARSFVDAVTDKGGDK